MMEKESSLKCIWLLVERYKMLNLSINSKESAFSDLLGHLYDNASQCDRGSLQLLKILGNEITIEKYIPVSLSTGVT